MIAFSIFLGASRTVTVRAEDAPHVMGNDVHYINNLNVAFGNTVTVEENATLVIENSTVRFNMPRNSFAIRLLNPLNGNPRLIIRNSTISTTKPFKVSLYGNSTAEMTDTRMDYALSSLELYDLSTVHAYVNCSFAVVDCHDSANLTMLGSDVLNLNGYDNSRVFLSTSKVSSGSVIMRGNSSAEISASSISNVLETWDSSSVSLLHSTFTGGAAFYDEGVRCRNSSKVMFYDVGLDKIGLQTFESSNVSIINSTTMSSKFSHAFSTRGSSSLLIVDCLFYDVAFSSFDGSGIKLEKSEMAATLVYSFNESSIEALDATIGWLCEPRGNSTFHASNSSLDMLSADDLSSARLENCRVGLLRSRQGVGGLLSVIASDSRINEIVVVLASANLSLSGLGKGYSSNDTFAFGKSILSVVNTEILDGWSLDVVGSSDLKLQDSELIHLGLTGNSQAILRNSTIETISVGDAAIVTSWSPLTVRVTDHFGSPMDGAMISLIDSGSEVQTESTGSSGTVSFELLDWTHDASGEHAGGNYSVRIVYGDYSSNQTVELAAHLLTFIVPIPWWYWHLIWGIAAIVVLLMTVTAVLVYRRRRSSK